ncbi:MAG: hypothetical protein KDI72_01345, partial [Xanthomonadales bacterium]|nr:hypothetical protein [Xanthomonadales bacterium]
ISALRQLDPAEPVATRLFAPAPAIRYRVAEFTGTPLPKDEPMAANPFAGAAIDYRLAADARGPVQLAIRDADGKLVREWSSANPPEPVDISKIGSAPEWIEQPRAPANGAGMHRFVWSLHYPSLTEPANAYADGAWAPPGQYTVELRVDGQTFTQALTVSPDPRVDLAPAGYAAAFTLARKVEALQARIGEARQQATALRKALAEKQAAATDPATRRKLAKLETDLNAISGSTPVPNPINAWAFPPKSTRSLTYLDRALGQLFGTIESADAAPSPDATAGAERLADLVEITLRDWALFREANPVQ